ncbi:MAG: (2Fe-2S)-binding protein [Thermoanaerobaculia bacterium]
MKQSAASHDCCEVPRPGGHATADAPPEPTASADRGLCPDSGTVGLKVDLITVKALLNAGGLQRLDGRAYRFCPAPECDVVYFDGAVASVFRKSDLTVRVAQKESDDTIPICYCFGYTAADIRRDLALRDTTDISAIITEQVKAGHCACEVKNPQGSCCLGNVSRLVKTIRSEASASRK